MRLHITEVRCILRLTKIIKFSAFYNKYTDMIEKTRRGEEKFERDGLMDIGKPGA